MVIRPTVLNKQMQGTAVVFALGLMTLVATLATAMIVGLKSDIYRVKKLERMAEQHAWILGAEATAVNLLTGPIQAEDQPKTFAWEREGVKVSGELSALPRDMKIFDEIMPVEGQMRLLHTRLLYSKTMEIYSLLKLEDEDWHVVYRSAGVRS